MITVPIVSPINFLVTMNRVFLHPSLLHRAQKAQMNENLQSFPDHSQHQNEVSHSKDGIVSFWQHSCFFICLHL